MAKYIFVSGGVASSCGKGISAASIGLLMKMRGEKVNCIKLESYYNFCASTLSPYEHGECWVCDDGTETDLDLGNYERIVGINVSSRNICTSGMIFSSVIHGEREGKYLGQTIQSRHLTEEIHNVLLDLGKDSDIVVAEIGGTCGDWESGHFFEAIRQFKQKVGADHILLIHVAPIFWFNTVQEFKTKPLQKSITDLRQFGLEADVLLCRTERPLPDEVPDKISRLTGIDRQAIFEAIDVKSIYQVPISFYDRHIDDLIADRFKLRRTGVRIHKYRDLVEKYVGAENLPEITVGVVGKYTKCQDAYLSLREAIYHAGVANNSKVNINWIDAEKIESPKTAAKHLENVEAVIVPGGFGNRGIDGMVKAIQYAREKKVPFLGICLGLQCAVIEFARNVIGIDNANSVEFDNKDLITPVVHFVDGMEHVKKKGGTLRLGAYDCVITKDSLANKIYNRKMISERHRHRYEFNDQYREKFETNGFLVSGVNPDTNLTEIMELDKKLHPFFVAGQFHPEFKSRLGQPHPLFDNLLHYAINKRLKNEVQ